MNERKLEIIKQLMAELESEMQHSCDDLGERLGRPKAEVAVEMEEPMEGELAMEGEMESPDDKFKQRIMKLRG